LYENPPSGEFEVLVIDNASTDGTVEVIDELFEKVITICNNENRGFAAANNQGIERSQSKYVLLLNPDTIIQRNSLNTLWKFMDDNQDVAACGPKLLNEDGTSQPSARRFPTFRGALYRYTVCRPLRIFRGQYEKWLMKNFKHNTQTDVDQLMGSALMIRKSVIDRVGKMDESFFMYYEEVDLCHRIRNAGWRIVFVPEAVITHVGGRSTEQIHLKKRIMAITSLLKFFRKHRGKINTALFNCLFKPGIILRAFCEITAGAVSYILAVVTANHRWRQKSAGKVKDASILLGEYSLDVLFKM
jgi:GT2 family glycosyltransferase